MKKRKLIRLAGFDYTSDRSLPSTQTNPKIKPLPELIGAYKTTVSKRINMIGDVTFHWQKSYHEHIIRNIRAMARIINYMTIGYQ
jgi:hypothetical protein